MADIRKAHHKILVLAIGLLVVIMSFTGFVNYMTFADNYNTSLVNTYSVAGKELVKKIEFALRYGKPIDNYYGMNDTLNELKDVIAEVEQVNIVAPSGEILYDLDGFVRDRRLSDELIECALFQEGIVNEELGYQFYEDKAYLFLRIDDSNQKHIASLAMIFPRDNFLHLNSQFSKQLLAYLAAIAVLSLIVLTFVFSRTNLYNSDQTINHKKVLIAFIAVLGSAQLVYSGVNYFLFRNAYVDMAYTSRDFLQSIVNKNIESVYSKGLSLQDIEGFEEYLASIKESFPQIRDISLERANEGKNGQNAHQLSQVNVSVSDDYVEQQMFKIFLDMSTVLVISIFFMVELTLLAVIIMIRGPTKAAGQQGGGVDTRTSHGLVRALAFFINLCSYMALTFVPVIMSKLYQPLWGLPRDMVLGLPLSAEMLGGILAIIVAGWSINKKGWRAIFYLGVLCLLTGNLLSGLSASAIPYIISRSIAGLGLGFIMMAMRTLVVSLPESNAAIAEFSAGAIAGLNCGAVIGGMLADRIGYAAVFYLAAVMAISLLIYVRRLMGGYEIKARTTSDISTFAKFSNLITDKKAILFLACILIPYFICGAFLDYFFPLFSSSNGLSQSDISRGILLNGLFIIYLGPVLTRYVTKKLGSTIGMMASMLIVVCALATFTIFGSISAAFITIILLGIAESFGVSLKTTYFLNLQGIKDLEINQGMACFSGIVNLSRMAGPMVYGMALSIGTKMGVGLISLAVLIMLLVFILYSRYSAGNKNLSVSG